MIGQDIIDYINKIWNKGNSIEPAGEWGDTKPTQSDKPSPSAYGSLQEAADGLKRAFPYEEGYKVSLIANTNSMEPFIDDNTVVVSERLDTSKFREKFLKEVPFRAGQVVIWQSNKGRIIHRLREETVFLGKPAWIIWGDNNHFPDGKIPESHIVARLKALAYCEPRRDND